MSINCSTLKVSLPANSLLLNLQALVVHMVTMVHGFPTSQVEVKLNISFHEASNGAAVNILQPGLIDLCCHTMLRAWNLQKYTFKLKVWLFSICVLHLATCPSAHNAEAENVTM